MNHNPLYDFCDKLCSLLDSQISYGWTDETYKEMINRLGYLIDNAQYVSKTAFLENIDPLNFDNMQYVDIVTGNRHFIRHVIRQPFTVSLQQSQSPLWGESELITLNHNSYLINIRLSANDGCYTIAVRNGDPILLRTPYCSDEAEELDIAIKFFEPTEIEDYDHYNDCINHFFDSYTKGNELNKGVLYEYKRIRNEHGRNYE